MSAMLQGCYVLKLGLEQNGLMNSRRSLEDVIADPATSEKTRKGLIWSQEVMNWAKAQGFHAAGAYEHYVEIGRPVVSWVVQAAEADRLKSRTWWFPVVGSVPYLGYFSQIERDEMAESLRREGYDVAVGGVGAFSSLGWFADPMYSSMLRRDEAELAHLLFHELTHRTYWAPGSVEFNENLAEFVADEMTERFLKEKSMLEPLENLRKRRSDRELLRRWIRELRVELEKIYTPPGRPAEIQEVLAQKRRIIDTFTRERKPAFALTDLVEGVAWNNASLLGASLYSPDTSRFQAAWRCSGSKNPGVFIKDFEVVVKKEKDVFKALDVMAAGCREEPSREPK